MEAQLTAAEILPFDPYQPFADMWRPAPPPSCSKVELLHRRRADILATARRLLAEDGFDAFTLRGLADACAVTTQTLYNYFGSRTDLLGRTLNEFNNIMFSNARMASDDADFFLHLAENYYNSTETCPDFIRQLMLGCLSDKQPMLAAMQKYATSLRESILRDMSKRAIFRSGLDLQIFGMQVCRINTCAMYEWAIGNVDLPDLRRQMLSGNGFLLLGATTPSAARKVEEWLDRASRH